MDSHRRQHPDPELLERYILGRLSAPERAEVERLAAEDQTVRDAIEQERRIAAGARLAGRRSMKARLAAAAQTLPSQATPWPRVLAAAASVMIIAGIVVVDRWLATPETATTVLTEEAADRPDAVPPAAESIASSPQPQNEGADEVREGETVTPLRDAGTTRGKVRQEVGARRDEADEPAAAPPTDERQWTRAQLYRPAAAGKEKESKLEVADQTRQADVVEPEPDGAPLVLVQQHSQALIESRVPGPVGGSASGVIPALVEQRRDTLLVTLYPDKPFATPDIERATVEFPTADSLLITIATQQIGLRLPPEFPVQTTRRR